MRLEEPDEAWLGGRLPISRLIQCSHKEELVDPKAPKQTVVKHVQYILYRTLKHVQYVRMCTAINMTIKITSHRTVGRPRWNCGTSLIKQDVSSLLANLIFRNGMNIAIIKAIPLSINGVLTLSYKTESDKIKI